MTDLEGDGWNGNILGVMQEDVLLGTFGQDFNSGPAPVSPVYIMVEKSKFATIFVKELGFASSEVGFIVKSPSGTVLFQRAAGTSLISSAILTTLCLTSPCLAPKTLNLTILMTSVSNGWSGNTLTINQNNLVVGSFGFDFISGTTAPPIYIVVQGNALAKVVVSSLTTST